MTSTTEVRPRPVPGPDDIQPVQNETLDRVLTGLVTALPPLALGLAAWRTWEGLLSAGDLVVLGVLYLLTGLGVTVGFHRLFTHRSFKTGPVVRGVLGVLGSASIEGPVISWVADHRKHHAFADVPGDPHSPHVEHGGGLRGALKGLVHAHVGWLFVHDQRGARDRYAPDLLADPVMRFVDRWFLAWAVGGMAAAFGMGWALGGTLDAALTALLWGGAVRLLLLHHATYSINSVCHVFGRRTFATGDESRNVAWLSLLTLGESWHNNHHAFPTSARHGLRRWQPDPSAAVIWALERLGLAWDVVRVDAERQRGKLRVAGEGERRMTRGGRVHAPPLPPWQFLVRAAMVITGLVLLLVVDAHGVAFYLAWALIVAALVGEAIGTLVYWRRSRRG